MKFRRRQHTRLSLDVTPLIDVIFLLLIFFMISTTFISAPGIHVNLPTANSKANPESGKPIEVTVTEKNEIYIDGRSIKKEAIQRELSQIKKTSDKELLVIKADGQVRHQVVVDIMDAAKQAGIKKLSIATRPKENTPATK